MGRSRAGPAAILSMPHLSATPYHLLLSGSMLVAVANEPAASRAEAIPIHDRRADHVLATLPQNGHAMHFSLGARY